MRLLAYVLVAASVFAQAPGGLRGQIIARHAAQTPSNLVLVVSNETAPAGGWAQFKVFAAAPSQITSGALSMDFDPAVFGAIADVAVFSATGDAAGYAHVSGNHVDAHFSSPSGGIGQLPGLPVLAVSLPVVAGLAGGATSAVTLDPSGPPANAYQQSGPVWSDTEGNLYSVAVTPGTFTAGGSVSIQSVTPGGGWLPQGTVVKIQGAGFDASATVAIDGVSIASTTLVSAQEIDVMLAGATEMTGKRVRVTSQAPPPEFLEQVDHFSSLPSAPGAPAPLADPSLLVFTPLTTYRVAQFGYPGNYKVHVSLGLENPTLAPVTVTFFDFLGYFGASKALWGPNPVQQTMTIPPGALLVVSTLSIRQNATVGGTFYMTASSPIRLLEYVDALNLCVCPDSESILQPVAVDSASPAYIPSYLLPTPIVWNWQAGTTPPQAQQFPVSWGGDFKVSVSGSAQTWLSASPAAGTVGDADVLVTLTPNVTSLTPGTYTGTVTVSYPLPPALSGVPAPQFTVPVTLNVTATAPLLPIPTGFYGIQLTNSDSSVNVISQTVSIASEGGPTPFTVSAATDSGGNWLSVSPASGMTPATLTIAGNRAGLPPYTLTGHITIHSAANTLTVPVSLYPAAHPFFVLAPGAGTLGNNDYIMAYAKGSVSSVSVQTQSGGGWLTASQVTYPPGLNVDEVQIDANAAGLAPGTYQGTVTVSGSIVVPVTLNVVAPPVAVAATPASLSLTAAVGQTAGAQLQLTSPGGPGLITGISQFTLGPGTTTSAQVIGSPLPSTVGSATSPGFVTPAVVQIQASASQPGTYYGSIAIAWNGGALTVPVTLSVSATASSLPTMAGVTDAASETPASLAPGEIVTVFGMGIGAAPSTFSLDSKGNLPTTVGGSQVLINGKPVPLLYASASQINAVVPYEVGTSGTATVQVISNGLQSATWGMPVAPAAPAIFTSGGGVGQGAVLNQDNSVNGASNPATAGSVIQIYATGGGQTSPASATGGIAPGADTTALPVTVTIGGVDAQVTYHGSAPGEIAGLIQINAVVPMGVAGGPAVPILITVGGRQSQGGVTIALR